MLFFSGEADLLDLKARVCLPLLWVLSLGEVGVLDSEANLFFTVFSLLMGVLIS